MSRALLREPLLHFLIGGAVLYALFAWIGTPVDPASRTISLSRSDQAQIAQGFAQMMGRPPTDAELSGLIERRVREEVLYREALRLGLDRDDPAVRRRLATKMDEIAAASAEAETPGDAVLEEWHKAHAGTFETGGVVNFEQVYFASEAAALAAKGQASPSGQPISLPRTVDAKSMVELGAIFGQQFAQEIAERSVAREWQGPIPSGFGWHLVRLSHREEGSVPPLAEIRDRVEADWRNSTITARRAAAYNALREAYRVEIE
ncbi:peptidyl-prolyl cis-trans isomerase [Qipengyuania marisflavi]|uniref:peptidylprolyl isomerase n=1 Tax=Qipengyuania marisflavi TaxID=2486356 RepID=UPI001485F2B6|nr:peptidylprolyl isomerase [Qipengyuania marisflavi]